MNRVVAIVTKHVDGSVDIELQHDVEVFGNKNTHIAPEQTGTVKIYQYTSGCLLPAMIIALTAIVVGWVI